MSAKFPDVEGDVLGYEAAIRSMVEYINGLVARDTGRSGAVTLRVEES